MASRAPLLSGGRGDLPRRPPASRPPLNVDEGG